MSGLSIASLSNNAASGDPLDTPLIVDQHKAGTEQARQEITIDANRPERRQPLYSPAWNGNLGHYQAQVISAELAKTLGRSHTACSPREAARAYGQARRRPEIVASQPRLHSVM